ILSDQVTAPRPTHQDAEPDTLLGWLQQDVRGDTVPDPRSRTHRRVEPTDRSVQVHATHGITRQVEVLRDALTGLLQDDPTLEPRDIIVMCPNVDDYAPAVTAAFGLGAVIDGGHPGHRI